MHLFSGKCPPVDWLSINEAGIALQRCEPKLEDLEKYTRYIRYWIDDAVASFVSLVAGDGQRER